MCCGRAGGFPLLSVSLGAKFTQAWFYTVYTGRVFLVVSAVIQEVRHSSSDMVLPVPSGGQGRVPDVAVSPLPPTPSPSHSPSQTPHLHSFSRKPLPALSPAAPFPGECPELPIPMSPVPVESHSPQPWEAQQL